MWHKTPWVCLAKGDHACPSLQMFGLTRGLWFLRCWGGGGAECYCSGPQEAGGKGFPDPSTGRQEVREAGGGDDGPEELLPRGLTCLGPWRLQMVAAPPQASAGTWTTAFPLPAWRSSCPASHLLGACCWDGLLDCVSAVTRLQSPHGCQPGLLCLCACAAMEAQGVGWLGLGPPKPQLQGTRSSLLHWVPCRARLLGCQSSWPRFGAGTG